MSTTPAPQHLRSNSVDSQRPGRLACGTGACGPQANRWLCMLTKTLAVGTAYLRGCDLVQNCLQHQACFGLGDGAPTPVNMSGMNTDTAHFPMPPHEPGRRSAPSARAASIQLAYFSLQILHSLGSHEACAHALAAMCSDVQRTGACSLWEKVT